MLEHTGKSLSEALIFASTNPQYDDRLFIVHRPVVPGCAGCAMALADQLTLFQPGGTDFAHLINTGTHGFSYLPTALLPNVSRTGLHLRVVLHPRIGRFPLKNKPQVRKRGISRTANW